MLVIAPLSANSLAKMVGGMCDNLLLSVVRAWDTGLPPEGYRGKRIAVAPAMNTAMWNHPVTETQVRVLEGWEWVDVLRPVEKELACGDVGSGAMREWVEVVKAVEKELGLVWPLGEEEKRRVRLGKKEEEEENKVKQMVKDMVDATVWGC